MVAINKTKLQAFMHHNFIDVEQLCQKLDIPRISFYVYLANGQVPQKIYDRLCVVLNVEPNKFIKYFN